MQIQLFSQKNTRTLPCYLYGIWSAHTFPHAFAVLRPRLLKMALPSANSALVQNADFTLYDAKRQCKSQYSFYQKDMEDHSAWAAKALAEEEA